MKAFTPKSIAVSFLCLFGSSQAVSLQEEPLSPQELSAEIAKYGEKVEASKWKPHWNGFWKDLKKAKLPGAHGTRGDVLESILKNGLGDRASLPRSSTDPKLVWFTPFAESRPIIGLLGAYSFALRDTSPKGQLKVSATSSGFDLIERYFREFEIGYYVDRKVPQRQKDYFLDFLEDLIRKAGKKYVLERGPGKSFPVILIYDVDGMETAAKTFIEFATTKKVSKERLRFVWVPAEDFSKAQALLKKHKADKAHVLPLELLELHEKTMN